MQRLVTNTILLFAALSAGEAEGCVSAKKRQAAAEGARVAVCFLLLCVWYRVLCAAAPLLDAASTLCKVMLCLMLGAAGIRHMGVGWGAQWAMRRVEGGRAAGHRRGG